MLIVTGTIAIQLMKKTDEEQVRDHYDRGDDFYSFFLGPRMIYTSGIISDTSIHETLEQLQDNKLAIVCKKIGLQRGEKMLDIGCGWGTLTRYASVNYGAQVTGITLGKNQTAWGNKGLRADGIAEKQSRVLCMDYRDIPKEMYPRIVCLEMAEHVGVRHFTRFLTQVYQLLEDDGVFVLQLSGLRKSWQYEDLVWGLFMSKNIFPGADASTPLGFYISAAESAGFEVKGLDTIGIHYSATMWRWYRNWVGNREKVIARYGERWYRVGFRYCWFEMTLTGQGLGILSGFRDDFFQAGDCYLLPDHAGEESELNAENGGDCDTIRHSGSIGCIDRPISSLPSKVWRGIRNSSMDQENETSFQGYHTGAMYSRFLFAKIEIIHLSFIQLPQRTISGSHSQTLIDQPPFQAHHHKEKRIPSHQGSPRGPSAHNGS